MSVVELDWYLVHTRPRQELVAVEHLRRQGYAAYLPRLRLPRLRRARWHDSIEPLFPRYLFVGARRDEQSLHPIRSTRGVATLVRCGPAFVPVAPGLLAELREREDEEGICHLRTGHLEAGDKVRILAGPFAGLEAVFQSRLGADRVRVLLELVGACAPASLDADLVVPASHGRKAVKPKGSSSDRNLRGGPKGTHHADGAVVRMLPATKG